MVSFGKMINERSAISTDARKRGSVNKALILEKAAELFWVHGYDRTSMKDIARACGFEPPNIYNYWQSKEQILFEVLYNQHSRGLAAVLPVKDDRGSKPVEKLRRLVHNYVDVLLNARPGTLVFESEFNRLTPEHLQEIVRIRDEFGHILEGIIREGIEKGEFARVDVKIASFALSSMMLRSRLWFSHKGRLTSYEVASAIFNFFLNGIRCEKPADTPAAN